MKNVRTFILCGIGILFGCKHEPVLPDTDYPASIEKIMVAKCATSGCHNNTSYQNAANLNLTNMSGAMRGGVSGSVLIPFSVSQSSLLQFINTYEDLGLMTIPTMPINGTPLSKEEVQIFRDWVSRGCPDKNGVIPFSSNPFQRGKAYITNQGCDLVSVVDADTRLVMRYVKIGANDAATELPHNLKVSLDGKYWYVCYSSGEYVEKYDAAYDTLIARCYVGVGDWNVLSLSPDGESAYVSDFRNVGKLVEIDLNAMTIKRTLAGSGLFTFPHGVAYSLTQDTIYVTAQYGNMIYRVIPGIPKVDKISLQKGVAPVSTPQLLDPHEVLIDPDYNAYFLTCQASNEVRVMKYGVDTLLKVISVGRYPLEMAVSKKKNELYVICQEDVNLQWPMFKGSVYVIDLGTYNVKHVIYERFFQPHGIAVDEKRNLLYVASRNADPLGPAPHHTSDCGGRNGFFHVLNLQNFSVIKNASELSVDPYSMDVRP